MEIEHYSVSVPSKPAYKDATAVKTWQHQLAHWISIIGSPPMLTILMTINLAALCTPRAWAWAGAYIWLAILTPLLYIVWQVRRGRISDIDVQLREQRAGPILVTLGCASLAWALGVNLLLLLIGLSLIAWSRVHLRRHTPAQVAAGAVLGWGIFRAVFGLR